MDERLAHELQNEERKPAILFPPSVSQPYPWLVIFDIPGNFRQTFYSIMQNRYYIRNIPEMHNKDITSNHKGWLFLDDNVTGDCFLFNMSTTEKLQLPPLNLPHADYKSVISSCTKMDNSCRILVIWDDIFKFTSCYLGDKEFVEKELRYVDSYENKINIAAAVNYEGKLYAMEFCSWNLSVADIDDPELLFTTIIEGDRSFNLILIYNEHTKFYLIESSGEIFFVYTNCFDHDGIDIKIFRADLDRKEWERVKSLDDRAMFLDDYKGLLSYPVESSLGLRGNCVYYVNTFGDRNLYVYDMENERIRISLPCPIVSEKYSSLFWAM